MATRVNDRRTKPADMLDGRRRAWATDEADVYKVYGRQGSPYRIVADNGMPLCECKAAQFGQPCYHAALVLARIMRELRPPCRVCGNWPCTCRAAA